MSAPVGFDEGALLERPDGSIEYVEVALIGPLSRGRWRVVIEHENGEAEVLSLRPEFLSGLLAQARAQEAAA